MKKLYIIPLLLLLVTACAEPAGNKNGANSNSSSGNANARAEALPAPPLPPNILPPAASQNGNLAAAQPNGVPDFTSATATKPAADLAKPAEAGGKQPKVMIAARRIDLGTQAPEKTITHSIRLKNEGKSELKIEDVVPG
ncbi:MAG TPA: hypothetical protein VIG62_09910 [Blastocatellia bacterium]